MEPKNTPTSRRIAAHYLYTPRGFLKNGILEISPDGTIAGIDTSPRVDSLAGVEFYSGILIPGLVNAHCHLELAYLRGAVPPGCGFTGFVRALREHRGSRSVPEQEASARYWDARMRAEGVAAVGDISNGAVSFPVKAESSLFYHTFLELYGLLTESLDAVAPLTEAADNAGLSWSVTPHAAYSLNRKAFSLAVGEPHSAASGAPLSIHFMESESERELFRKRGAMWEWYAEQGFPVDFLDYGSPAERILETVPADRNLMLIHNTFVREEEVAALQARFGERLTWVLCPQSNRYITGEQPPVELLRRHDARIAVGTDSLASNTTLSVIGELKSFPGVPIEERLGWATAAGAAALGLGEKLGSLEVGKRPGVALLEGVDWRSMDLSPDASTRLLI